MAIPEPLWQQWGQTQPLRITDGITHRQLSKRLKEAAAEAQQRINANLAKGTFSGQVRAAQLQKAMVGMQSVSTTLWNGVGEITKAGMYVQAQLAADQSLDMDFFTGMPSGAVLQLAQGLHYDAGQAVNDIISRRTDGFKLADRIYAHGQVTTRQVGAIVERGLAQQLSAREIAKEVRGHFDPNVPGGTSYAAMRLARTEINNAHHTTSIRLSDSKPWVIGYKWNLSESHPRPDPCDEYAHHNEGLGEGVFSKGNAPAKPHPQCLCYLTHVLPDDDEFINSLVDGHYDEYMQSRGVTC